MAATGEVSTNVAGLGVCDVGASGADTPCWFSGPSRSLRGTWHRGLMGLRQPAQHARELWKFSLEVVTRQGDVAVVWPLASLLKVRSLNLAAQFTRCGCFGISLPALTGFEVCLDGSGEWLRLAVLPADQSTLVRLQLVQTWICRALEAQQEVYTRFFCHGAWAYVVPVEWPMGGRENALGQLAGAQCGVHFVSVHQLGSTCRFAGDACPVCLEHWVSMPPGAMAVALPCSHACCAECLGLAAGTQWWSTACPVCRALPILEGRTSFPFDAALAAY